MSQDGFKPWILRWSIPRKAVMCYAQHICVFDHDILLVRSTDRPLLSPIPRRGGQLPGVPHTSWLCVTLTTCVTLGK